MPCCKKKNKTLLAEATEAVAAEVAADDSTAKGGKKKWLVLGMLAVVGLVVAKALRNNATSQAWQSNYKPSGS
ncbi:MAG: hypothetical protein U0R21_02405 [Nocardioidaceae bacterium]